VERPGNARKAIRFPLEVPIAFWWVDRGIEKRSEGRTRDISETGAFIFAPAYPPLGTQVCFNLLLPMLPGLEAPTRVEAEGQVLRVERPSGRERRGSGFAILTRRTLLRINNSIR
jgi:hypothetical protein